MTSFNYLRSPGPPFSSNVALYGVLIVLAALTAYAGCKIVGVTPSRTLTIIQRQPPPRSQHHTATSRDLRLYRKMRPLAQSRQVDDAVRWPTQRRSSVSAVQPAPQSRLAPVSAGAAAVSKLRGRVQISVLGIVTGSRPSALVLVSGKTQVVTVGDFIGRERVAGITDGRIVLSNYQIIALGNANR